MTEPLLVAVIIAVVGPAVLFGLNRAFGGAKRDKAETEATVAAQWKAWSEQQGKRIDDLENDVAELRRDLAAERDNNRLLTMRNERQSSLLTSLIRWAILLRDEVVRLGGMVPPAPVEVESALTTLDP